MARPIRVVELVSSMEIGGAERVALSLAKRLPQEGFETELWSVALPGSICEQAELDGVKWRSLADRVKNGIRALAQLLRSERIDLLHSHGKRAHFIGAPAARLTGTIYVHTRHASGETNVNWRTRLTEHAIAPLTHIYIAVSEDVQKRAARYRRIVAHRSMIIPNGIDTDLFHPTGDAERATSETLRIGCVARLSEEKRHEDLLAAAASLKRQGLDFRLILVGEGPLRADLERQVRTLGLSDCVEILGTRNDIADLMRGFDLFALSSRCEGLPLTVLEAMATGLPVVATDVGSLGKVIREGETGFLVPPGVPEALADAIQRAANADFRKTAAGAARRVVEEQFSLRKMTDAHAALFKRLLAARGISA